jgi:[protein-PII] uridylyltransferase
MNRPAPATADAPALRGRNPADTRRWLKARREELRTRYLRRPDPQRSLAAHAALVDSLLARLWTECIRDPGIALVAVGGYGRATLFPHSDVDLLVLLPDGRAPDGDVERFVGLLWDCGLEPGNSVRTLAECIEEAGKDVTVDTSLLEARPIAGNMALVGELGERLARRRNVRDFFRAKVDEQRKRHDRFQEAAYNLEPNIKESPGGLRDLQTVLWLARAAGIGASWAELAREGVITPREAAGITRNERVLQDLRLRLHHLAGRREDRLVFDHQIEIARQLKLKDAKSLAASDLLMRRYYLAAKANWRFNQILLANLYARIVPRKERKHRRLDADFRLVDYTLDLRDESLFEREPGKIFDAFRRLQQDRGIANLSATALRSLSRALPRIDRAFREDPANRERFMEIVRGDRFTWTLRRMSRYGVLGRYIPAFGRIVGQMQHDLFHVYTVDEHILMVIRNLRRFRLPKFDLEHPFCSKLMQEFDAPEVLYLAALFHDIAKGRGGDHSTLGARDAERFCRAHGVSRADAKLVAWLVEHHLTMSATAQKQDLSDPEVISQFATLTRDERSLTALYILTVADIRGTSPKVWNAWKGKLLEDLFRSTRRILRGDTEYAAKSIEMKKAEALRIFRQYVPEDGVHEDLWKHFGENYFQRFEASEIGWHTRTLFLRPAPERPVVRARLSPIGEGLQVMVYAHDQPGVFARITGFFERHQFDIAAAKIYTTGHGFALDGFQVLSRTRAGEHYRDLIHKVEQGLAAALAPDAPLGTPPTGRVSRWVKHFPFEPKVEIVRTRTGDAWQVFATCADRPGLLSAIARAMLDHGLNLIDARVTTLGARAEDVFVVSGAALDDADSRVAFATQLRAVLAGDA